MFLFNNRGREERNQRPSYRIRLDIHRVLDCFPSGVHRSAMMGRGIDFKGLRGYDPSSDELAQIDWLTSARMAGTEDITDFYVRDFHPEREISVVCAVDTLPSMSAPTRKKEYASQFMLLFALSAFKCQDRFLHVLFSQDEVSSSGWVKSEDALFSGLYTTYRQSITSYLSSIQLHDTLLVVVSDFSSECAVTGRTLRLLNMEQKNIRTFFIALDEWDGFRPFPFGITLFDPNKRQNRRIDLRKGAGADSEKKTHDEHLNMLARSVRSLGVPLFRISLLEDPFRQLHRGLLRHGFS